MLILTLAGFAKPGMDDDEDGGSVTRFSYERRMVGLRGRGTSWVECQNGSFGQQSSSSSAQLTHQLCNYTIIHSDLPNLACSDIL